MTQTYLNHYLGEYGWESSTDSTIDAKEIWTLVILLGKYEGIWFGLEILNGERAILITEEFKWNSSSEYTSEQKYPSQEINISDLHKITKPFLSRAYDLMGELAIAGVATPRQEIAVLEGDIDLTAI